jgi:predicted 3-demethylubiquinone-9 3-methyltransferase (glyoxalase superfamily)/uncharacterized protein YndB with AHSA1/START domain
MQKIIPTLWYDDRAEEAVDFYISLFRNSRIIKTVRYSREAAEVSGRPEGSVMTVDFEIEGQKFIALNGGPIFTFSPAISFLVNCEKQQEVDRLWEKLSADSEFEQCGWLRDRFGVSWQIVPDVLEKMLEDPDPEKSRRVMQAMLGMKKLDIEGLRKAYEKQSLRFEVSINAPREKVWNTMLHPDTYKIWTSLFAEGSYYEGSWDKGSKIKFLSPGGEGMTAVVSDNKPFEYVSIQHLGFINNGVEDTTSDEVKAWAPAYETYTFTQTGGMTDVRVEMDLFMAEREYFEKTWPAALEKLKELSESESKDERRNTDG